MKQLWKTWLTKLSINFFPAYRRTGARVVAVSDDWKEVKIRLPLNWKTRNYVGTIFGGSLYSSVDPIYMLMLIEILGPEYIVWDKSATIRFKRPGRATLYATFKISDPEIETIKNLLKSEHSIDRKYEISLTDERGIIHTAIEKIIYISKKSTA